MTAEAKRRAQTVARELIEAAWANGELSLGDTVRAIQTEFAAYLDSDPDAAHEVRQYFLRSRVPVAQRDDDREFFASKFVGWRQR